MKKWSFPIALGALLLMASSVLAVDHNNLDAGRPLDFDDAEVVAFGERSLEVGGALFNSNRKIGGGGDIELLYGLAKNSHVSLAFDPRYAADNTGTRRSDFGDIGVGFVHNFNREYGGKPALALRADAYLPSGRDSQGIDFRLRGIASRQWHQYDRLHLNLDLDINNSPDVGERKTRPGIIVGYSRPLGYPTRFDRTLLAQLGYHVNPLRGENGLMSVGLGLRQQVTVRSVLDVGVISEVTGGNSREKWRLNAGYSTAF